MATLTQMASAEGTSAEKDRQRMLSEIERIRRATEELCRPLQIEDYVVQSMPDASPAKWHLAHTTWFFESFILAPLLGELYGVFHPHFNYLFNSYYVSMGDRHCRAKRGMLTRPSVEQVFAYRRHVDDAMRGLLADCDTARLAQLAPLVDIGVNHEQQHQELLLTDLKHLFWCNPLRPSYSTETPSGVSQPGPMRWLDFPETLAWIGHDGAGFAYDNESPRHRELVEAFQIGSRLVTNAEYLAFIEDDGYRRLELWLSDGWATAESCGWQHPLYWQCDDGRWLTMTLSGMQPLVESEPVCHVSFYEADAYARWPGHRLPRESEWEVAAAPCDIDGTFVESRRFHPAAARPSGPIAQMFGDCWQWTASGYLPYPGYRVPQGPVGEYNGKFMCNQFVLRGGSCATPRSHIRRTYRNFFVPQTRWQFSGIRLARDL